MPHPRTTDYLRALHEHGGTLSEQQLANVMGVAVPTLRAQLAPLLQSDALRRDRDPSGGAILTLTDIGAQHIDTEDVVLDVLDELRVVGPTSPLDLAEKFSLDRARTDAIMAHCAQLAWIDGYDASDPSAAVRISERGERKLDAADARGIR